MKLGPPGDSHRAGAEHQQQSILKLLDRELSPGQLDENTARVGQPMGTEPRKVARVLVCRLHGETLALPATDIDRVAHVAIVHRIPHRTNRVVRGIVNMGGELQLCGSLADLLGMTARADEASDDQRQRMVVLGRGRNRWSFLVDEVFGVAVYRLDHVRRPPMTVENARDCFVEAVISTTDRTATLLKTDRILSGFRAALP
ncbi:MAG: chemotaxis protein CheW [Pirellulales bacterium]